MSLVRRYGHLQAARGRHSLVRARSNLQTNGSSQILRSTKLQSCKRAFVRATSWRTTHWCRWKGCSFCRPFFPTGDSRAWSEHQRPGFPTSRPAAPNRKRSPLRPVRPRARLLQTFGRAWRQSCWILRCEAFKQLNLELIRLKLTGTHAHRSNENKLNRA